MKKERRRAEAAFHRRYDLLLTPSVAVPALKVGELLSDPATQSEWVDWALRPLPASRRGAPPPAARKHRRERDGSTQNGVRTVRIALLL